MTKRRTTKRKSRSRGALARPLDALVFLLPMIVFYESIALFYSVRVISFEWLQRFLELFGQVGVLAPGLAVITILLTTHIASHEPWRIHWKEVGTMYVEALGLALPLLALSFVVPLQAPGAAAEPLVARLARGIGAGIYEELVFRLAFISVVVIIGHDMMRIDRTRVAVTAVILSSLAFSAHHHQPIGSEPFVLTGFIFRAMAGAYLAAIFWFRGYGAAAGCHAAYNVAVALIE